MHGFVGNLARGRAVFVGAIGLLLVLPALGQAPETRFPPPTAQILLLGTFHFRDAGLDSYKPRFDVDILSESRQEQVRDLVGRLARFRPTKVAVEVLADAQETLDRDYQAYLRGELELSSREIHQVAFCLARELGHDRLWAADARARRYEPWVAPEKYAREHDQADLLDPVWDMRYFGLYRRSDEAKTEMSLRDYLLYLNSEERLLVSHGDYLVGAFEVGNEKEYPGVDAVTAWYNRNLRIFANLQRMTDAENERILLLIGAGHVPILRHAVRASPVYELVEASAYLAD